MSFYLVLHIQKYANRLHVYITEYMLCSLFHCHCCSVSLISEALAC